VALWLGQAAAIEAIQSRSVNLMSVVSVTDVSESHWLNNDIWLR